jgi:STE24 endopeptidase
VLAAVAMVIVAEGAVWLLRPRDEPPDPAAVEVSDYFDPAAVERAEDFRRGQLILLAGGLAVQGVALGALALGRPAAAGRILERLGVRPVAGAAAAGAGISVVLVVATLPLDLWSHERAVDAGVSTQSLGPWLGDVVKAGGISTAFAAAGSAALVALVRRFPSSWPVPGTAAVVALSAAFSWLAPVLLAPVFNDFEPLPAESELRGDVLGLAASAGVDVGEVYRVDASRRSTSLNAYVGGLGPTKRVVLYDNLISEAERPELRSVVAHELAHQEHRDILRGLLFLAIVAPLGLVFTREAAIALAARRGVDPSSPAALPAYFLALGVASLTLTVPGNQLSRAIEASADDFAIELTGEPAALVELQQRLTKTNVSDPDPPGAITFLLGSHPPAIERIGAALAREDAVSRPPP